MHPTLNILLLCTVALLSFLGGIFYTGLGCSLERPRKHPANVAPVCPKTPCEHPVNLAPVWPKPASVVPFRPRRPFNRTDAIITVGYPSKSTGGLNQADRELLARIYYESDSVFETGVGESTKIALYVGVPRLVSFSQCWSSPLLMYCGAV